MMINDTDFDEDEGDLERGSRGNSIDRTRIDPHRFEAAPVPSDFNVATDGDEMSQTGIVQQQPKTFFQSGIVRCGMFSNNFNLTRTKRSMGAA
jgi:hypothetical protein